MSSVVDRSIFLGTFSAPSWLGRLSRLFRLSSSMIDRVQCCEWARCVRCRAWVPGRVLLAGGGRRWLPPSIVCVGNWLLGGGSIALIAVS